MTGKIRAGCQASDCQAIDPVFTPPLQGSCCPQLQVLEVSTGISRNSTPLQLPVEALQKGCPQLQVSDAPPCPPVTPFPICSLGFVPRYCDY